MKLDLQTSLSFMSEHCILYHRLYVRVLLIIADRVVDELAPERHLTVNDIITLMSPLVSLINPL